MRKILTLAFALLGAAGLSAQGTTMLVHTANGNITQTDVAELDKITFTDTLYNLNSSGDRILEYDEL